MADSKQYHLHDVVRIAVDKDLPRSILDKIDFQLTYFKSIGNKDIESVVQLSRYKAPESRPDEIDHYQETGVNGEYWHDPTEEIVVERTEQGYHVLTNNPNININVFLQLVLLRSGISLVHAAGVMKGDDVTLLAGGGGVGKTALVGSLVNREEYQTLGDDVICLGDDGLCHAFPREFVLKEYHREVYPEVFEKYGLDNRFRVEDVRAKIVDFAIANAPFLGIFKRLLRRRGMFHQTAAQVSQISGDPFIATVPITDLFGSDSVADRGELSQVVFLQRCGGEDFQIESVDSDQLGKRLFAILQTEWKSSAPWLFSMGTFDVLGLDEYFESTLETLVSGIEGVPCHVLSIPREASPEEVHRKFVRSFDE